MSAQSVSVFDDDDRLRFAVGGRRYNTRIPLRNSWSTLIVCHPFEDDGGVFLSWTDEEKAGDWGDVLDFHATGRHAPTPGELDVPQATALLRILMRDDECVNLAFRADVLVAPSSRLTVAYRDEQGAIDLSSPAVRSVGGDPSVVSRLCRDADGVMKALDDGMGGWEAPSLIWPESLSWMIDSPQDLPVTIVSGEPSVMSVVAASPALDLLTPELLE